MPITYHQPRKGTCAICGEKRPARELTATVKVLQVCLPCAERVHSLSDPGRRFVTATTSITTIDST